MLLSFHNLGGVNLSRRLTHSYALNSHGQDRLVCVYSALGTLPGARLSVDLTTSTPILVGL